MLARSTGTRAEVGPGDVLVTRSRGWVARLIRARAAVLGKPSIDNHVAVLHHLDRAGTWWAIEGRPDGIGWADAGPYLADRHTVTNVGQPKTARQRAQIINAAEDMLGVAYDWRAVLTDALMVAHLESLTNAPWPDPDAPGHLVCSSLAAYLYRRAGLDHPHDRRPRYVTPADWAEFIIHHRYSVGAGTSPRAP